MKNYKIIAHLNMHKLILIQVVLLVIVSGIILSQGQLEMISAIYGGVITLTNTWLLAMRVKNNQNKLSQNNSEDVRSLYIGAIQRFVITLSAMAMGMGVLMLNPISLLVGFAVTQFSFLISPMFSVNIQQLKN